MPSPELLSLIDRYLDLLRGRDPVSAHEAEATLAYLLDAIALHHHHVDATASVSAEVEAHPEDYTFWRALAEQRFPRLGLYNSALPMTAKLGEPEMVVGDAIDDVADIAIDLAEVAWRWRNVGEADALWHFQFTFTTHWGQHLRDLQRYLHAVARGE